MKHLRCTALMQINPIQNPHLSLINFLVKYSEPDLLEVTFG